LQWPPDSGENGSKEKNSCAAGTTFDFPLSG
jgi:hypothetical protein